MENLRRILENTLAGKIAELVLVASVPLVVVSLGWQLAGDNFLVRHAVVWIANLLMLLAIWMGLRLRRQPWKHFGLDLKFCGWGEIVRNVLRSAGVLAAALGAFVLGSIPMVNLGFTVQKADMSSYSWLHGSFAMLMVALPAVYLVSSFGEEVIYRGFLITRLGELGKNSNRSVVGGSVVSSAVVFGLIHFAWGVMGVVQTTCMGLALAASYLVLKRNLWPLILAHGYMDTLLLLQIYLGPTRT